MIKSALVLDLNNLYFSIQQKFGRDYKLQVDEYVKSLENQGHVFVFKVAYSTQTVNEAHKFISLLKGIGFETNFANVDWQTAIALHVAQMCQNVDSIILGSTHEQAWRLLNYAKSNGKITKCVAAGIPHYFREYATCVEITKEQLKCATHSTKILSAQT